MSKKRLWWIVGGGLALLAVLIIIAKSKKDKGTKIAIEAVALHTITESVTASGKIYPETEVKISPEVSGEIIELPIEEGDSVHKGQLLVKINPAIYNSQVTQAEAAVEESRARVSNSKEMAEQAKAQFDQAKANYERNRQLYKDKVISAMEFEQAEANFLSAKASYEASKTNISGGQYSVQSAAASLSQARENQRRTTIFAPTSGIVSQLKIKSGERVVGTAQMAGTELLTIADMSRIEVRVDVSETDIAKVKLGDTTIIDADAYRDRKFKGIVSKIGVSSNQVSTLSTDQVTNYTVHILILPQSYADLEAKLPAGKFVFKPGMSASVEIITKRENNILSVPVNAVTTRDWPDSLKNKKIANLEDEDIRQVVFVYNKTDKKVNIRDVQTGIQDNLYIQIKSGLKENEEVVIAPYGAIARTLKDKSDVTVVEKEKLFETDKKKDEE